MISIHHENARDIVSAGVNVYVTNLERSHAWYRDVLGLKMEKDPDGRSSCYREPMTESHCPAVFRLLPRSDETAQRPRVALAFQVGNLDATVASLRSFGVTITREKSYEDGCALPSVSVLDPDGGEIVLYEM